MSLLLFEDKAYIPSYEGKRSTSSNVQKFIVQL
jgi:hypothetical protein